MILSSIANYNVENWTNIFNYIFIGLIVIVVLAGVVGLIKGVWKTTFKFVVMTILFILIIVLNRQIAMAYWNLDLGFLENFSIDLKSMLQLTSSDATTVGDLLFDYILSLDSSLSIIDNPDVVDVVNTLALSILSLLSFIVDFILVLIVGTILSFLLYHCAFKFLIPKRIRKKKKLRPLGALVNMVQWTAILCIGFSPLTSLVNTVNDTFKDGERVDLDDDLYNALMNFLEGYNNSVLGQTLTSVRTDDGRTLDLEFFDFLTTTQFADNTNFVLSETLGSLLDAVNGIYQSGNTIGEGMDFSMLLEKEIISMLVDKLGGLSLLHRLLPIAISLALNMDAVKENIEIDPNSLDFSNVDWEDELHMLNDVYDVLYDMKIVQGAINNNIDFEITSEHRESTTKALVAIDNSEFFKVIMPSLMSALAKSQMMKDTGIELSSDIEDYTDIKWGQELAIIFNKLVDIDDLYNYRYNHHFNWNFGDSNLQEDMMNLLLDEEVANGITYVEEGTSYYLRGTKDILIGHETVALAAETSIDYNVIYNKGLLDMDLIFNNISVVFDSLKKIPDLKSMLEQANLDETIFDEIQDELNSKLDSRLAYKNEIAAILDCACILINNPNLPLTDGQIDFENAVQRNEIRKLAMHIDDSITFTKIIPNVLESVLDAEKEVALGIKYGDLDFRVQKIGSELVSLIDIYDNAEPLLDVLNEPGADLLKDLNFDDLQNVLLGIFDSAILNPTKNGTNANFKTVIRYVFEQDTLKDVGFILDEKVLTNLDTSTIHGWRDEIKSLCYAFKSVQNADSLIELFNSDQTNVEITSVEPNDVRNVFDAFDQSQIIKPSIGSILNKNLKESFVTLGGENVDFTSVEDWSQEGESLALIIESIREIARINGDEYISLDKIDWINTDSDKLENLLLALYDTQTLGVYEGYDGNLHDNFADIIYTMLVDGLAEYAPEDLDRAAIREDFNFRLEAVRDNKEAEADWIEEIGKIRTLVDDLKNIKDVLGEGNDFNIEAVSDNDLRNILTDINKIYPLRTFFPNMFQHQLDQLQIDLIDVSSIKVEEVMLQMYNYKHENKIVSNRAEEIEKRQEEIDYLCVDAIYRLVDNVNDLPSDYEALSPLKALVDLKPLFEKEDLNINDVTSDELDNLKKVLEGLYSSKIFNYQYQDDKIEFSFFENLLDTLLDKATLTRISAEDYAAIDQYLDSDYIADSHEFATKGEITHFIEALKFVINSDIGDKIINNEEIALTSVDGDEVASVFQYFDESLILRPSLAPKMNENLKPELAKLGAENANFNKVKNWTLEGEKIGDIIKKLQNILATDELDENNKVIYKEFNEVDWFNVETDDLRFLINRLYDTEVLGVYDGHDNFADIVHEMLINAIKDYGSNDMQDENSDLRKQIKKDFMFRLETNPDAYWRNEENANDENAEINKICKLFDEMKSINKAYIDGNLDFEKIDENNLKNMLYDVNSMYTLRSFFPEIINFQINQLDIGLIDTSLIMTDEVINKKYNYCYEGKEREVSTREEEIAKRKVEIDYLAIDPNVRIIENEGKKVPEDYVEFSPLKAFIDARDLFGRTTINTDDITEHHTECFEIILKGIYNSRIFNYHQIEEIDQLSFFESIFDFILDSATLTKFTPDEYRNIVPSYVDDNFIESEKDFANKGEITYFIDAIRYVLFDAENTKDLIITDKDVALTDLDSTEVREIFKAMDNSNLLRPSLAPKVNDNIKQQLIDLGATEADFYQVKDWTREGNYLGNIIDSMQKILDNGDGTYADIGNINWLDVNTTDLEELLVNLAQTEVLDVYEGSDLKLHDNFADIMLNVFSDVLEKYFERDYAEINNDFYFRVPEITGREKEATINVNWITVSAIEGQIIEGQIQRMITVIDTAKEKGLVDENGTININLVDGNALYALMSDMNNCYVLRTTFANMMYYELHENTKLGGRLNGLDQNKIYIDVFNYEFNMLSEQFEGERFARSEEIALRQTEIDDLFTNPDYKEGSEDWRGNKNVNAYDQMQKFATFIEEETIDGKLMTLDSFSKPIDEENNITALDAYEIILRALHNSRIFNTAKDFSGFVREDSNDSVGDLTFFEQVIRILLDESGLTDMAYDTANPTYDDLDRMSATNRMSKKIKYISDEELKENSFYWFAENEQDPGVADDLLFTIREIMDIAPNNLDSITSLSNDNIEYMLDALNNGFLTNEVVTVSLKKVFEKIGIDEFRIDSKETETELDYFYYENLYCGDEQKYKFSSWSQFDTKKNVMGDEINAIMGLINRFEDGKGADNFNYTEIAFEDLLVPLGNSKILTPMRADFIYTMFDKAELSNYISNSSKEYLNDPFQEAKQKRDILKYLEEEKINSLWDFESSCLDNLVKTIADLKGIENIKDFANNDTVNIGNIVKATYETTIDKEISRGYLASELVSGFLNEKLTTELYNGQIVIDWRHDVPYAESVNYSYEMFNDVEADGLSGLIRFVNAFNKYKTNVENVIKEYPPLNSQGNQIAIDEYNDYCTILENEVRESTRMMGYNGNAYEGKDSVDSIAATRLFNSFKDDIPSVNIYSSTIDLKEVIDLDYQADSYEERGEHWSSNIDILTKGANPYTLLA